MQRQILWTYPNCVYLLPRLLTKTLKTSTLLKLWKASRLMNLYLIRICRETFQSFLFPLLFHNSGHFVSAALQARFPNGSMWDKHGRTAWFVMQGYIFAKLTGYGIGYTAYPITLSQKFRTSF